MSFKDFINESAASTIAAMTAAGLLDTKSDVYKRSAKKKKPKKEEKKLDK